MGVSTFVALSAADPAKVVERIASRRLQLYTSSRNWPRFGIGWTRRLFEISFRSLAG
jgi:lysozyme family protein